MEKVATKAKAPKDYESSNTALVGMTPLHSALE